MDVTLQDLSKEELIQKILKFEKETSSSESNFDKNHSEFYFNVLENINDLVFVHPFGENHDKRYIIYANSTALNKLNYSLEEIRRLTPTELILGAETNNLNPEHEKVLNEGSSIFNKILIKKNKTQFAVELNSRIIELDNKKVIVTVGRDNSLLERTKKSLHKSEQSIKAILNAAKEMIMLVDPSGEILETNDYVLTLLNVRKYDVIGRNISWFIGKSDEQKRLDFLQEVVTSKKPVYYNDNFLERTWETSLYPVFDEHENVISIATYLKDTTLSIQSEKKLKENKQQLEMVLKAANLGWWDYNFTNDKSTKSDLWYKMLGYERNKKSLDNDFFRSLIHPEDFAIVQKHWEEHEKGITDFYSYEHRLLQANGKYKWIYNWGQIIKRDEHGNPLRSMGVHMDVTKRKKAEEKEQILMKSYFDVINNAIDAIYILDEKGKFVDVNSAALKMYGHKKEVFIGKTPEFLSAPGKNNIDEVIKNLERAFNGEQIEFDFWGLRKNGEIFPKIVRLSKVNYLGKDSIAAFGLDISDRFNAEQKLKSSEERYRTIFNQVPLSITQIDINGKIVDINNYHLNQISKGKKNTNDFIGTNVLERETIKNAGISNFYKDLLSGTPFDLKEVKFPFTTSGEEAYFNIQGVPLISDGKQIGALITTEDTSQTVTNRKILEDAEIRLGLALDGASIAFWDHNLVTDKVFRSDQWFEMLGYKKDEFDNNISVWTDLMHPDDIDEALGQARAHRNQETIELKTELRLRNSKGEYQWILNWGRVIERAEDGSSLRAAGIHMDITDRKVAEEGLLKSEEHYRALFESQPTIIWDEDFSLVKKNLNELKHKGIKDFKLYFDNNPIAVHNLAGLVKINDFNKETLTVLEADSKDQMIKNLPYYFNTKNSWSTFKDELVAIASNQPTFESEVTVKTLKGNTKHLYFKLTVPQKYREKLERVIVSMIDITDLKESTLKLIETQQKYLSLVDQANEGIIINQDWKLKFANKYFADLLGYDYDEIINMPFENFISKDNIEEVKSRYKSRIAGDPAPQIYESVAVKSNGDKIPIEINSSFMIYEGKPAVQSIVRNISLKKKVEKEKDEKQKELSLIYNSTSDLMALAKVNNKDFNLISFNNMFWNSVLRLNPKLEKKQLDNLSLFQIHKYLDNSEDFSNSIIQIFRLIIKTKQREKLIENIIIGNENYVLETKYTPIFDENDNCTHILYVAKDMTKQSKAEQKTKLLAKMLETSPIGYLVTDTNGVISDLNPALEKITGYSRSELLGKNPEILNAEENAPEIQKEIFETLQKEEIWEGELLNKKKNGETHYISSSIFPLLEEEKIIAYVGFQTDITTRKNAEIDLAKTSNQLELAVKGGDIGIFSWEIKKNEIHIDQRFLKSLGYTKQNLKLITPEIVKRFTHPGDFENLISKLEDHFNNNVPTHEAEMRAKNKDGEWVWYLIRSKVIEWDANGNPSLMTGTYLNINDRKLNEDDLQKTKEQLEYAIYGSKVGIWDWDIEAEMVGISYYWANMLGYELSELNPMTFSKWQNLLHQEDKANTFNHLENYFQGKSPFYQEEFRMQHKSGNWIWVLARGRVAEWNDDKTPKRMVGTHLDISERKKAEFTLKNNEGRFRALYENAPLSYQSLSKGGFFIDVNPAWLRNLGYEREEVIDHYYGDFLHPKWKSIFEQNFEKFKKRGYVNGVHFKIRHKKGHFLDIEFEGCIGYHPDGSVRQTYCVFQDITEQKKTVLALRENEKKYRALYDNALIALFRISIKDQKVIEANRVASELFGYSSVEEFIDKFNSKEQYANFNESKNILSELFKYGSIDRIMIHSKKKDGSIIFNESSFLLNEKAGYIDCFFVDSTDRVVAEKELKETNKKLRNLYRYLNKVREEERKNIAREVHDNLGQKLTALNLDISWFKQNIPENMSEMSKKLDPALELINESIVTVQQISTSLRPGILDDLGLVNAIQWQSNEYSRRTNLKFELNLVEYDIKVADDIKTAIFRVYQETLTNIVRHANAKNVTVNLSIKKRNIIFEIIDNGVGIPKNKLDDLNSFGLIGIKERIASINGIVEFKNRIKKGTKIKITVPLMENE